MHTLTARGIWKMWHRDMVAFRKIFWQSLAPSLVEPLLFLAVLTIGLGPLLQKVGGVSYVKFILPGLMASAVMFGASFECTYNTFTRMRYQKIYSAIMASPVTIDEIVVGELLSGMTRGFLAGVVLMAVLVLAGMIKSPVGLLILPLLVVTGLMFSVLAMSFTSFVPNMSLFNYYFSIFTTVLFMFSGIFFPMAGLPKWAQNFMSVTPLMHAVRLSRTLVAGKIGAAGLYDAAYLLVLTIVILPLPVIAMRRRVVG